MDMGTIRGLITLVLMLLFIGIVIWSWSSKRKNVFEEASKLPLENDTREENAGELKNE